MLDLLIVLLLLGGLITGFRRGLVVQIIHMTGFIVALIVAYKFYKPLADKFVLWIPYPGVSAESKLTFLVGELNLEGTFYRLLAFILIFIVVKVVLQIIGSMFDYLKYVPVLGFVARLVGAFLGFIEFYMITFLLLYLLALIPAEYIQNLLSHSILAGAMFDHTPLLSETVKKWWYIYQG